MFQFLKYDLIILNNKTAKYKEYYTSIVKILRTEVLRDDTLNKNIFRIGADI